MPPKKPAPKRGPGRPADPTREKLERVTFWLHPKIHAAWKAYVGRQTPDSEPRNATTVFKRLFEAALAAEKETPKKNPDS